MEEKSLYLKHIKVRVKFYTARVSGIELAADGQLLSQELARLPRGESGACTW